MDIKKIGVMTATGLFLLTASIAFGAEHGGKEHGGKEFGKEMAKEPSNAQIQQTMKKYVDEQTMKTGVFEVLDPVAGSTRKLKLMRVHERVGKTGDLYYSCADFTDLDSGETLDLDLDVQSKNGALSVSDVRIHKVNGKERYVYDEKDNRIPMEAK